jgi:hypothetical protein
LATSSGRVLIKTTTDNGTDALQVAGSVRSTSAIYSGSFMSSNSGFSSYVADGLFGGTAQPTIVTAPSGKKILQGYWDNGAAGYFPRIGFEGATNWSIGIASDNNSLLIATGNSGGLGNGISIASTGAATFSSSVSATGFFETSDKRLKTLISDNYNVSGIDMITPKLYQKNGKTELGYYAQDLVGVLDSAVTEGQDGMLSLSYREVLVAKVYALEQEVKELKAKLK